MSSILNNPKVKLLAQNIKNAVNASNDIAQIVDQRSDLREIFFGFFECDLDSYFLLPNDMIAANISITAQCARKYLQVPNNTSELQRTLNNLTNFIESNYFLVTTPSSLAHCEGSYADYLKCFNYLVRMLVEDYKFPDEPILDMVVQKYLITAATEVLSKRFSSNYESLFADIETADIAQCIDIFTNSIAEIQSSPSEVGAFTHYLMRNKKLVSDSFVGSFQIVNNLLTDAVLQQRTNQEYDHFKNRVSGKLTSHSNPITLDDIDMMSGIEFEHFLAELFKKLGYSVQLTEASGDQGVDLVIKKNGQSVAVQAKCYSSSISNSAIQQISAGSVHYKCDKAMVITNSRYTSSAIDLALSNNVILWDREILKEKLALLRTKDET